MMRLIATIAVMMFATPGLAAPAPVVDDLLGRYGFNWAQDPAKATCAKVDKKFLADLKKTFSCDMTEKSNSASGSPHVVCSEKSGKREYLIFKTKKLCEEERDTQSANGP